MNKIIQPSKKQMKNIIIHLDYGVSEKCQNLKESYGEICVKCGKCGRNFFNGVLVKNKKEAKETIDKLNNPNNKK